MSLAILVYLIGLISSIKGLAVFLLVLFLVFSLFYAIHMFAEDKIKDSQKLIIKLTKWVVVPSIIAIAVLPSKTDMYVMSGLVVGEKLLTSEKGNIILDKSYTLLLTKLDESIEDSKSKDKPNTDTTEENKDAK